MGIHYANAVYRDGDYFGTHVNLVHRVVDRAQAGEVLVTDAVTGSLEERGLECEPIGDSDIRISVDPAQPYGVRLVCRRPGPATQSDEAVIAVLISADHAARAAA